MTKILNKLALLLLCVCLTSCSLFVPRSQTFCINSEPQGALVIINNQEHYYTPALIKVSRKNDVRIRVEKDGYEPIIHFSDSSLSVWGATDILGACIWGIPVIGLVSPGAWYHEDNNFNFFLRPKEAQ